jgi:hypothetical protein
LEYEGLLICSYFAAGAVCAAIGWFVYVSLRRPMREILAHFPSTRFRGMVTKSFPVTTFLAALYAFTSVDYYGCSRTYHAIVSDRAYMIERNQEQIWAALRFTSMVLLFWVVVVSIVVLALRIRRPSRSAPHADRD